MKNWTDVYKLPLTRLKPYVQVFDQNRIHVFDFEEDMGEETCNKLLKIINNEIESDLKEIFEYEKDGTFIHIGKEDMIIDIRGWGYLTGIGGLNLIHEEAANIQDSFAQFIIDKFNGSKCN